MRIIRACRDLGIDTVAVHSQPDRAALHVRLADEAWECGPARAADSYLNVDRLLDIAERSGADAVHPGYGFLSENGDFADACHARGVRFIGPRAEVLRAMGDKVTSRRIMRDAGVPVVPGSAGELDDAEAHAYALEIGLPVVVKASGGGGGRGMRVVREEKDLAGAIERARSEAKTAFASERLYVEKLVERPRHVEVQVFADRHGGLVHCFERECSVQRRHQKLLEEAPANGVDDALRGRLGQAALTAARAVDYEGVGTVEFLLDAVGDFHFLEMNTRVQVEHPVTEAVTSVDVVRESITIAAGQPLSFTQDDLAIRGHAIEARIYAEDPGRGFLPAPGRIGVFRAPDGPGVRVDAGVQSGDVVTPHYDALLAKVIAWGNDRAEAMTRLDRALAETVVTGIRSNVRFHRSVLASPAFRAGRYTTSFVEDHLRDTAAATTGEARRLEPLAVAVAALHGSANEDASPRLRARVEGGAGEVDVEIEATEDHARSIRVGNETLRIDALPGLHGDWSLLIDGRHHEAWVTEKKPGRLEIGLSGFFFTVTLSPE